MAGVGPNRGQRLIDLFVLVILIAAFVAIAIYTGFHRFLFFLGVATLASAVGWFSLKVNKERVFTAYVLFPLLTMGIVLLRDWFMAGIFAVGLVALTVLRHLPGLTRLEPDSKQPGA